MEIIDPQIRTKLESLRYQSFHQYVFDFLSAVDAPSLTIARLKEIAGNRPGEDIRYHLRATFHQSTDVPNSALLSQMTKVR